MNVLFNYKENLMGDFFTSIKNGLVAVFTYVKTNAWVRYVGTFLAGLIVGIIL